MTIPEKLDVCLNFIHRTLNLELDRVIQEERRDAFDSCYSFGDLFPLEIDEAQPKDFATCSLNLR